MENPNQISWEHMLDRISIIEMRSINYIFFYLIENVRRHVLFDIM